MQKRSEPWFECGWLFKELVEGSPVSILKDEVGDVSQDAVGLLDGRLNDKLGHRAICVTSSRANQRRLDRRGRELYRRVAQRTRPSLPTMRETASLS